MLSPERLHDRADNDFAGRLVRGALRGNVRAQRRECQQNPEKAQHKLRRNASLNSRSGCHNVILRWDMIEQGGILAVIPGKHKPCTPTAPPSEFPAKEYLPTTFP